MKRLKNRLRNRLRNWLEITTYYEHIERVIDRRVSAQLNKIRRQEREYTISFLKAVFEANPVPSFFWHVKDGILKQDVDHCRGQIKTIMKEFKLEASGAGFEAAKRFIDDEHTLDSVIDRIKSKQIPGG